MINGLWVVRTYTNSTTDNGYIQANYPAIFCDFNAQATYFPHFVGGVVFANSPQADNIMAIRHRENKVNFSPSATITFSNSFSVYGGFESFGKYGIRGNWTNNDGGIYFKDGGTPNGSINTFSGGNFEFDSGNLAPMVF